MLSDTINLKIPIPSFKEFENHGLPFVNTSSGTLKCLGSEEKRQHMMMMNALELKKKSQGRQGNHSSLQN